MVSWQVQVPKLNGTLTGCLVESWPHIFKRLYKDDAAGSIFLYEKNTKQSVVKHPSGDIEDVTSVFPRWLTMIAFDPNGSIMKHAVDVAIMLDTLAHDNRLDLAYLIPVCCNTCSFQRLANSLSPLSVDGR